MTTSQMVTDFKPREIVFETPVGTFEYYGQAEEAILKADLDKSCIVKHVTTPTCRELCRAVTAYCKSKGLEPDEYGFNPHQPALFGESELRLPEKWWHLIAFVVEGGSEGFYIHIGAMIQQHVSADNPDGAARWIDLGLAKTYSPDNAYALATEAQRFLMAAEWNA